MSRNHVKGKKCFAVGALFGGLVGGITALLLAPKTGAKMRKELAKKYCSVSDKTCELIEGVCSHTSEWFEKAKDLACDAKEAACKLCRKD